MLSNTIFIDSTFYFRSKNKHPYRRHRRKILPLAPPVLLIPVANLPPVTGVNYTGGKFGTGGKQWEQYQTADNFK
jgi:hypothetical protein